MIFVADQGGCFVILRKQRPSARNFRAGDGNFRVNEGKFRVGEGNFCVGDHNLCDGEHIYFLGDHKICIASEKFRAAARNFRFAACFFLDAEGNFRFVRHNAMEDTPTPAITLAGISRVLGDPSRWAILRELGKGEPLPVNLIAKRIGVTKDSTSKHMAVIRKAGIAQPGLGRLYTLTPSCRPAPGATHIDFGHCLIRLEP